MPQNVYHIPALLGETVDSLKINGAGTYIDATLGGGGHSAAILERLTTGHLYSFDQDRDAVDRILVDPRFAGDDRFTVVYGNFRYLTNFMRYYGVAKGSVDGILADLGVSFHHFDEEERGFSFRYAQGPLDMRMNRNARLTAASLLADATEQQVADMLYLYGELKNARRIATGIIKRRQQSPILTVDDLLQTVAPFVNPKQEKKELAQIFQALRIVVNNELDALRRFLTQAVQMLAPGGRLAVITYHSLEDRLVKNFMKTGNFEGKADKDFYGRVNAPLKLLTSKPLTPTEAEVEANPRSRSAKLRVAEAVK